MLDASLTLAWHFIDEVRPETEKLARRASLDGVVVPLHWHVEVTNSLLMGERRKRSTIDLTSRFIARLQTLQIEVDSVDESAVFDRILPLARAHGLTIYDALYLELAERRGLPLGTLDGPMAVAGRAVGLEILGA